MPHAILGWILLEVMDNVKKKSEKYMLNKRFGKLVVLASGPTRYGQGKYAYDTWFCRCDCGNEKIIFGQNLRYGRSKSCGCDQQKLSHWKHGQSHTRLHNIWIEMKERCEKSYSQEYAYYGGRGISVCEQWHDFKNFYDWAMVNGYEETLTIDRIDNNGNYCPENCRWATYKQQARNRRSNRYLTYNGETKLISDWAKEKGIILETLRQRLDRGWSVQKALSTKVKTPKKKECTIGEGI